MDVVVRARRAARALLPGRPAARTALAVGGRRAARRSPRVRPADRPEPGAVPPPYEAAPHALGTWPAEAVSGARDARLRPAPDAARAAHRVGLVGRRAIPPCRRRAAGAAALAGARRAARAGHPAAVLDELPPARRRRPRARRPRADLRGPARRGRRRDPAPRPLRHRPPAVRDGHLRAGHRPAPGRLDRGGRGRRLLLGGDSTAVAAAATALAAVAVAPLRRRLQRRVDRRLYPARRAALAAIDDLRRASTPGRRDPSSCRASWRPRCAIRRCGSATGARAASACVDAAGQAVEPGPADGAVPVCWGGEEIGVLCAAPRPPCARGRGGRRALVEVVRLRIELARRCARSRPAGPGWCRSATRSGAGSSATCTTAPSSGWSRWGWRCGSRSGTSTTARSTSTACSTRPSPSSAPPSPSCARSRTACGRAASTTGCARRWSR